MMDNDKVKEVTEEVSKEEQSALWEEYVRDELNSVLDIYLPISEAGNVGIRYGNPETGRLEDGTVIFDSTKVSNVLINIVLKFEKPIDTPK